MNDQVIWRDSHRDRVIVLTRRPSDQTVGLLSETVWGSRDTKYRILNVSEKLDRLRSPSFFALTESARETCVLVMDHCRKKIAGTEVGGYHFVMASTVPDRQNEGLAGQLLRNLRPYLESTVGLPGFGFAYVESTTEFTLRLSESLGHTLEAEFAILLFTRLRARPDSRVGTVGAAQRANLIASLVTQNAGHELQDFESSHRPDECRVYRRDGRITAAVQAEVLRWSVVSMPGLTGKFLMRSLPGIPGLRNVIDLRDLRIVRFGNLLVSDGAEADFFSLLESCLHEQKAKIAMMMIDTRSPLLGRLRQAGRFGLLSRALEGTVKLHIDTVGMEASMIAALRDHPLLVSPADVF